MIAAALYSLLPAEQVFVIGEPIWLWIHVDNRGGDVVSGSVEAADVSTFRTEALSVTVTGPDGQSCPDPWHHAPIAGLGGGDPFQHAEVQPGRVGDLEIDLTRYAWLDAPGTYEVRLLAPFGDRKVAPLPDDPRWVRTTVEVKMPSDVAGTLTTVREASNAHWGGSDLAMFGPLGQVMYVSGLETLGDERAVYGLGSCPCPEATEALLRLYDTTAGLDTREAIREEIRLRIPRPDRPSTWFIERAWHPRFEEAVLTRARAALTGSTQGPGWADAYVWAAEIVGRFGDASDAALLTRAMERTLEGDESHANGERSYVIQTLDGVLRRLGAPRVNASGDSKLVLDMQAWDGRTGDPPPGWEAVITPALMSDDPTILAEALRKLPWPASRSLVDSIVPHIGSQDGLSHYVHRYLTHHPPGDMMRAPLFAELATAEPWRVEPLLIELRPYMPLPDWINLVLVKASADATNAELVQLLTNFGIDTSACKGGWGGRKASVSEAPDLVTAWMAALRTQDLNAGPITIVPGTTDVALVQSSWSCTLSSGDTWPAH